MRRIAALAAVLSLTAVGASIGQAQEIGAIGRIAPAGGVVLIGGPPAQLVRAVHVRPGDAVKAGDPLLTLDDDPTAAEQELAALDAQGLAKLAEERAALQATAVRAATQRLRRSERDLAAYRSVGTNSTTERETSRLEALVEEARAAVELEQAKLTQLRAEAAHIARVAARRMELTQGRAALAGVLRAPVAGTVLRVERRIGERLGGEPAVHIADLSAMQVVAQVHEGDLLKLATGMKTTVRSTALTKPLSGTVERISRIVDTRSRLGEVAIRLDSPDPANRLVGMEVEVLIAR
jgi:HlyD family secretion protein